MPWDGQTLIYQGGGLQNVYFLKNFWGIAVNLGIQQGCDGD